MDYLSQAISDWLVGKPLLGFNESTSFANAAKIPEIKAYASLLQMTYFICEIRAKHKVAAHFQRNYFAWELLGLLQLRKAIIAFCQVTFLIQD